MVPECIRVLPIFLKIKSAPGELGKLDDMIDIGITSFETEIADGVQYDDLSNNVNTSNEQIKKISRAYFKLVAPEIQPVEVEKYLPAKIGLICPECYEDIPSGLTNCPHCDKRFIRS